MEEPTKEYLKGYKDGFTAAIKIVWAYAEELFISVNNDAKEKVREFINKISA